MIQARLKADRKEGAIVWLPSGSDFIYLLPEGDASNLADPLGAI
jgi:hypothetical protein